MIVLLTKSNRKNKKYMVKYTYKGKLYIVNFGGIRDNGEPYEDYTMHKDPKRRELYLKRHANEKRRWAHKKANLMYSSYLSRWLLWEKPNFNDAIKNVEKKLDIKIKFI